MGEAQREPHPSALGHQQSGHAGVALQVRPDGFESGRDPELAELE
jgi:hypothetical protein